MIIALSVILIILVCILVYLYQKLQIKVQLDNKIKDKNEQLKKMQVDLQKDVKTLNKLLEEKSKRNEDLKRDIKFKQEQLTAIINKNEEVSRLAFKQYAQTLEDEYRCVEEKFDFQIDDLTQQINELNQELNNLKITRAEVHEAFLREQEIKDNKDNYRLLPSQSDLTDARRLEIVKRELNKPRILSMLIWQTYWQPLAKKQFPLILQAKTKCGIYKITNLITDECYIGQSVDVYKRFCDHCKCGLGIDAPPGNKLYKAMQEYGLDNFTFELISECSQSELNEKEKYFISLYQADTYGYNSNIGVGK